MKKGNASIVHVGNTILAASVESITNENLCLLDNQSTCNTLINGKTYQISEMLPMENIYMYIVTKE